MGPSLLFMLACTSAQAEPPAHPGTGHASPVRVAAASEPDKDGHPPRKFRPLLLGTAMVAASVAAGVLHVGLIGAVVVASLWSVDRYPQLLLPGFWLLVLMPVWVLLEGVVWAAFLGGLLAAWTAWDRRVPVRGLFALLVGAGATYAAAALVFLAAYGGLAFAYALAWSGGGLGALFFFLFVLILTLPALPFLAAGVVLARPLFLVLAGLAHAGLSALGAPAPPLEALKAAQRAYEASRTQDDDAP